MSHEGKFFIRRGKDVRIVKTDNHQHPDNGGSIAMDVTIDDATFVSAFLTMTEFNERPNDWHAFMDHFQGNRDLVNR